MHTNRPGTSLRQLTTSDLPSAVNLSTLVGWNQTECDWNALLRLQPEGCFAIDCEGEVVATASLICYRDQLAWLGMVLTHPSFRRQGFARRVVSSALSLADEMNIGTVKLDATDQGLPLYESLGFRSEQLIERWWMPGGNGAGAAAGRSSRVPNGVPDYKLDQEAFGADRRGLLEILAEKHAPWVLPDGFALSRPGVRASYLGPCVARSPESARRLAEVCLSVHAGDWFWDLLPANHFAVRIAKELGFTKTRTLTRMVRGRTTGGCERMIYAAGGFELG